MSPTGNDGATDLCTTTCHSDPNQTAEPPGDGRWGARTGAQGRPVRVGKQGRAAFARAGWSHVEDRLQVVGGALNPQRWTAIRRG